MNLRALLESKIREYDASIDLSSGSRIQRTVIAPVVSALSVDPLSVSTRDYLYSRFSEVFPDSPITRGNALDDILITASEYFFAGYREELNRLKNATSLDNIDLLSDDEADALASNWFVNRDSGSSASGSVTVTVDRTSAVSINPASVRFFAGDVAFAPSVNTIVSTDALLGGGIGGGLYQFTVNIRSVELGTAGNVGAGRITRASGIPNVVAVTNQTAIVGGIARDTTSYLLSNKLPRAISERSLVTARGIGARIATDIPGILRYQVVGHGDVEMVRDRVSVQSHSDLIASGHAFYMGNFAIIAGYPYTTNALLGKDKLCGLTPTAAAKENVISRVLSGLSLSVLNGNVLGFTTLVELNSFVQDDRAAHVSILRPGTSILGDTLVSGEVGLGGRVDLYLRGDNTQSIVGSAVLISDRDEYAGRGWTREGNVVHITLTTPIEGDEFSRFDHIVMQGVAYTISEVRYTAGQLTAELSVFDQDFEAESGTDYYIASELVYSTGRDAAVISPSNAGFGRLSAVIGSNAATMLDVNLLDDGVVQGDIIEIPELGVRRSVFSVSDESDLLVDTPFQQTVSDIPARIIRSVPTVVSPVLELDVPSIMPQHPLSIDVTTIREEVGVIAVGEGNILLPLGASLRDACIAANVGTVFANVLNRSDMFYRILTQREEGNAVSRLTPVSLGYAKDELGQCSVLVGESTPLNADNRHPTGVTEFNTWTDLFTENANNLFVLRGDTRLTGNSIKHPGADVQPGDILRIRSGYLSGEYVIESVIHNTLVRQSHNALTTSIDDIPGTVLHTGAATYRDITDVDALDPDTAFQYVTLIRIYGEFPNNPMTSLTKYLTLSVTDREILGVQGNRVGSIDAEFLNAFVNGNASMFSDTLSSEILTDFREAVSGSLLSADVTDRDFDLREMFSDVLHTSYEIVRASEGIGYIRTRNPGDHVLLERPSISSVDVNDLINALVARTPRFVRHRSYTEVLGRAGVYHLSPRRPYYVGGDAYKDWVTDTHPAVYDNRAAAMSFADRLRDEFVLYDELLEPGSSGVLPVKVHGPSALDAPYLKESGSQYIRYPEVSISSSPLSLVGDFIALPDKYIFVSPAFAEAETRVIPEGYTTPLAYVLREGDEILSVYGDIPALKYIYVGTPQYDELLASLGEGLDGTGARLVDIYSQYDAFFELDATHERSQSVLEYLVASYGMLVNARFWREQIPAIDHYVTDEFLFESLLSSNGRELSLPPESCRPISIATIAERADKLEIIPTTTLSQVHDELAGARIRIDYRGTVYWRTASYVDALDVYLDEPLPFGTPNAIAYGICIYDKARNRIRLISDPIFQGGDQALTPWTEEFSTHLNTGGASREITLGDIGNHITLWGYRCNEADHRSVLLDGSIPEYETEADFLSELLRPERETFGQFEITDVIARYVDSAEGSNPVPASIEVTISGSPEITATRASGSDAKLIACGFVITPPAVTIQEGEINSVVTLTAFSPTPYTYNFVGMSKDILNTYLLQPVPGSLNYAYELISDELVSGDAVSTYTLVHDNTLEPATVSAGHLIMLSDGASVIVRTTNATDAVKNESMYAEGAKGIGYDAQPADLGESLSTRDDVHVHVPCVPGPVPNTLSVSGYFDPTTGLAQSLVSLTSERPVCADLLVKSLYQAYIGVAVVYEDGPAEEELSVALREFIQGRVVSDGAITRSMISSLIMNMGASTVQEPIDLYVCVEDRSRRVHKRVIRDGLEEGTLFSADVTLRTTYYTIPESRRLGAEVKVERVSSINNLIGNGGS